jgi:Ran GTPase-activating protein (RanGAP) involved in mRNA processing and transport
LTKFVREFPRIQHIDLGNNAITNKEMEKFMATLKANQHIQNIHIGGNKGIGGHLKRKMQKELEKNQ